MNTLGHTLRLTTFGESHGVAVGGVIDGLLSNITIDMPRINKALQRRREGDSGMVTTRQEPDHIEWLSGLLDKKTTGHPLAFLIRNVDCNSEDYAVLRDRYRPGHADKTQQDRYGLRDWRGGGRCSGRETVVRVVAGILARQVCERIWPGFSITASDDADHCVRCTVEGVASGLGSPLFDRLNARLAHAMMSIPSAIGFEMGAGFAGATWDGATWRDEWTADGKTQTNHCGGVQGGISNGMPIVFRTAFHAPVTTTGNITHCLRSDGQGTIDTMIEGRHDRDTIGRLPVIVEAMACWTLADLALTQGLHTT